MRPSPTAVFVGLGLALALTGGAAAIFAKGAAGALADDALPLPSDAERFGFLTKTSVHDVPLLESTRPFEVTLGNGPIHGTPPSREQMGATTRLLDRELGRYPKGFFRKIKLAGIVLTNELAEGETPIPSLPNVGGLLLLDTSSVESDLVRALHHELYHFVDLADDGQLAPDPTWQALNGKAKAPYGAGGRTLRGAWAAKLADDLPGFLSAYATSGVEEDKAETFAFCVARPAVVRERFATDPALTAKVTELTRRLRGLSPEAPERLGIPSPPQSSAPPR